MGRCLIIEADASLAARLSDYLGSQGHLTERHARPETAMPRIDESAFDIMIVDSATTGGRLDEILSTVRERSPESVIIVMAANDQIATAVRAVRRGATDFIQKPVDLEQLALKVEKGLNVMHLRFESVALRGERNLIYRTASFVGQSPAIRKVLELVEKVAQGNSSVIIQGETGTGKELIAGAIHYNSRRANGAFIRVNCAALPDTLLESELFGHEKGAFTGAEKVRIGRFEQADGGTIFLDEIGDISPTLQSKLLRVVQEKEFERLGSNRTLHVDVRVISATNRSLAQDVEQGRFRADLYYRLNVLSVTVPPLRERGEDIVLLAKYFLLRSAHELDKKVKGFEERALEQMRVHSWPGNVRELKNTVERAVILCESDTIRAEDLQIPPAKPFSTIAATVEIPPEGIRWDELERALVIKALEMSAWSQKDAAHLLGLSTRVLNYKVRSFGITHPSWRQNR